MEWENVPSVVCLGFFDGVHRGHQALLQAAKDAAEKENLLICVHTFDHAPSVKDFELTTLEEREKLLWHYGAQRVAVSHFDDEMRHMPGDVFFREIVAGELQARHVVCGDDHRFGFRGAWGVKELKALCDEAGIGLTVVAPIELENGQRISSTAIRKAIEAGNTALAEEMLGRKLNEKSESIKQEGIKA